MSEILKADAWITQTLKANAALMTAVGGKVYGHTTPTATPPPPPYIWFQLREGVDLMTMGGNRVWANFLYLIRGVTETGGISGLPDTIANGIDLSLHNRGGVVTTPNGETGYVAACVRIDPFLLPETREGRTIRHMGGIYRVIVQ